MFVRENGEPVHPQTMSRSWERAIARCKTAPGIRFHDARHSHATMLLTAGEHPKVVQERLGHTSIELTLNVYSHVLPLMQEGAAARVGNLLFGS